MNRVDGKRGTALLANLEDHAPQVGGAVRRGTLIRAGSAFEAAAEAASERQLAHLFRHWRGSPAMDRLQGLLARHLAEYGRP